MPKTLFSWLNIVNLTASKTAELNLSGIIGGGFFEDGVTAEQVKKDIDAIKANIGEPSVININITNSPGGSVLHALAIYDMLATHTAKKVTKGIGLVASAATIIHQVGDDRELSPNAKYLVHRARGKAEGTTEQIIQQAQEIAGIEKSVVDIYVARNKKLSEAEILGMMNENNGIGKFMSTEQAIEKGFADTSMKVYKVAAMTLSNEEVVRYRLPENPAIDNINNLIPNNMANNAEKNRNWLVAWASAYFGKKSGKPVNIDEIEDIEATGKPVVDEIELAEQRINNLTNQLNTLNVEKDRLKPFETQVNDLTNQLNTLKGEKKTVDDNVVALTDKLSKFQKFAINAMGKTKLEEVEDLILTDQALTVGNQQIYDQNAAAHNEYADK